MEVETSPQVAGCHLVKNWGVFSGILTHSDTFYSNKRERAVTSHLPHEDLSPVDEHRGAGDAEPLLQSLQVELLHLLIAALHLDRVKGEHGQPLHVLWGRQI